MVSVKPVFVSSDDLVEIVNISFLSCHQLLQHLLPPEKAKKSQNMKREKKSEMLRLVSYRKRFCAGSFQRILRVSNCM